LNWIDTVKNYLLFLAPILVYILVTSSIPIVWSNTKIKIFNKSLKMSLNFPKMIYITSPFLHHKSY